MCDKDLSDFSLNVIKAFSSHCVNAKEDLARILKEHGFNKLRYNFFDDDSCDRKFSRRNKE